MTTTLMPICLGCIPYDRTRPGPGAYCTAFPDGIPDAIFFSEEDHREPFEGDHGIRFDPVDEAAAVYAEDVFTPVPEEPYQEDEDEQVSAEERTGVV